MRVILDLDDILVSSYGQNPRKHVVTLTASYTFSMRAHLTCALALVMVSLVQTTFVADNYLCSSGITYRPKLVRSCVLYCIPLRSDGDGCTGPCTFCAVPHSLVTDDLELRVCSDESLSNENISIQVIDRLEAIMLKNFLFRNAVVPIILTCMTYYSQLVPLKSNQNADLEEQSEGHMHSCGCV